MVGGVDQPADRVAYHLGCGREVRVGVRLWENTRYHDLGADFYDNRIGPERKNRTRVRQLEALGYKVTLEPAA